MKNTNLQTCNKCIADAGLQISTDNLCPVDKKPTVIASKTGVCPLHLFTVPEVKTVSVTVKEKLEETRKSKDCNCSRH